MVVILVVAIEIAGIIVTEIVYGNVIVPAAEISQIGMIVPNRPVAMNGIIAENRHGIIADVAAVVNHPIPVRFASGTAVAKINEVVVAALGITETIVCAAMFVITVVSMLCVGTVNNSKIHPSCKFCGWLRFH